MFKLSRKGWNNVIIVVVLIVITLLHRLEQAQQENSAKRARPLLPESAVVLTWQGPSWQICLLYTSPSPRDRQKSRMPSSA